MSDKISRLFKSIEQYLPYFIKDEMQKREVMRWLEKSLKEQASYGEEQRKGIQESLKADIMRNLYNPEYFKGRNVPELSILDYIKKTNPELISGTQAPPDIEQQIGEANQALAQLVKYQMAGEIPPQEVVDKVSRFFGEKTLSGAAGEIVKQKEAAAERGIRGREVGVQEALVPVRQGELKVRQKETAGGVTAKEAKDDLFKLGVERRRYQAMLETDILSEEKTKIEKSIQEIAGQEKRIIKTNDSLRVEYEKVAKSLKAKGYTSEHLKTNEMLIQWLFDNGYNIEVLKDIFR